MISTRNFAIPSNEKIGTGTIMQEATPNVGNLSSKLVPLKWDLISIKRIYGLIHNFPRSINCFKQRFVWVPTAFRGFWYTYICFGPNYRAVVVASIQIVHAKRILDMAYFRHYYYYGQLLSIIEIYNPEETRCYARPASVIINSDTGLKCWPCRCRTPSRHYQAFFNDYADTKTLAWILDVSQ